MGAVLFGFMYCNRSSQEQRQQAATEQQADATAEAVATPEPEMAPNRAEERTVTLARLPRTRPKGTFAALISF